MEIRPVELGDLETALAVVNTEGWEYAKEEVKRELLLNPGGSFFFADPDPVGIITTLVYGCTGVIGHLVVARNARGRGVGHSLLKHAIDYLDALGVDSTLLYATPEGARLYRKFEFSVCGMARAIKAVNDGEYDRAQSSLLAQVVPGDLAEIVGMDQEMFGDNREKLIWHLYEEFPKHSYKLEKDGHISGYVFGRESSVARDLGPWGCVSQDRKDAEDLFGACLKSMGRGAVFFGVFEKNQKAWEIANKLRILRAWPVQLMVRGRERYTGDLDSLYGIVGFELG